MVNAAKGLDPALKILEKWMLNAKGIIEDERRDRIEKLCLNFKGLKGCDEGVAFF